MKPCFVSCAAAIHVPSFLIQTPSVISFPSSGKPERDVPNVITLKEIIEYFHLKPVNEFSEFNEFLIDICRTIATCIQM